MMPLKSNKKPKTQAERKRAERARKREAGLKSGEVWARPEDWPAIREAERQSKINAGYIDS